MPSSPSSSPSTRFFPGLFTFAPICLLLLGCSARIIPTHGVADWQVKGTVHGGQQPIIGATVQLYAAGTTGYGTGATPLLSSVIKTDADGAFSITGTPPCAQLTDQVYLVITGGNPGAGTNSNITMMSALGYCGSLNSSTFVAVNEVTSVASAYALAPYMLPGSMQIGTISSDLYGLATAFANVNSLVDTATGLTIAGSGNAAQRQTTINSLADSMAACVDSNGSTGECSALFAASTPASGLIPTNTLSAIQNIVANPTSNVSAIYILANPASPFEPSLSAPPNDWSLLP